MKVVALLALLALVPSMAEAQAPFDLDALRQRWPGANAVLLERHLVFDMPDAQTLRVRTEHQLAVLDDSVQEDLVLFSSSRRPGCRSPGDLAIHVVDRHGVEQPWDGEVIELVAGDHPVESDKSTVTLSASRRGLSAGALLTESWNVDYDTACFDGFVGTERYFVDGDWPVEHVLVEVPCAGRGCFAATDIPGALEFTPREGGGVAVEAWSVPAPAPEFSAAQQGLPVVVVANSDDPYRVGRLIRAALPTQIERAGTVAAPHRALADQVWDHVSPRSVRIARYLAETVPRLPDRPAFWQFGFDWGGPVAAGRRPLLPLEWWTLALALLEPHGGVPILLDTETHLDPPAIGRVVSYDALGVLLPGRGVLTDGGWYPLTAGEGGEGNALLAGMWMLSLGTEPALTRLPSRAALERRDWELDAAPTTGDKLLVHATRTYTGARGAALGAAWNDRIDRVEDGRGRRAAIDKEARSFASEWLFGHRVGASEVVTQDDDPGFFSLATTYSREGLVQRGDAIVAVSLPMQVHPELRRVVPAGEPRRAAFEFSVAQDGIVLLVEAPAGHRLVGLPPSHALSAGPVRLNIEWSQDSDGARLRYTLDVPERVVGAEHAAALAEIGEELRALLRTRLLFVPDR